MTEAQILHHVKVQTKSHINIEEWFTWISQLNLIVHSFFVPHKIIYPGISLLTLLTIRNCTLFQYFVNS
jgi:hypothetical protein